MSNVAAIYHFTDGSEKRPIVNQKQLNMLEQFAISQGFSVGEIYCDKSLLKCEQSEFDRFMADIDKYDVLVTKDFYHISKNTMKCMSVMKNLRDKGIQHGIKPSTFYNWISRLCKKSCFDIPEPACGVATVSSPKEVVKLEIMPGNDSVIMDAPSRYVMFRASESIEVTLGKAMIRFSNDVDPALAK